jgi:hypothetical protein
LKNDICFRLYHASLWRNFLKIHTCDIVPICYKCWTFSFDGSKFKGTLYVDQCIFLFVSWLPLEGFHSVRTWNNMGILMETNVCFHWYLGYIGGIFVTIHICDSTYTSYKVCKFGFTWSISTGTVHEDQHLLFAFMFAPIRGICVKIHFKSPTRIPYKHYEFCFGLSIIKVNLHEQQCTVLPLF